ncbi:MAG: DUF72 domain-containing protein [Dehalococcoidia bacterium]|jgi:uncharacterized protein YecE (DUF72 family)
MGRILIGISSWADPALLKNGFYPEGIKTPAERLAYYSTHFAVAEIDSAFHIMPTRTNLNLWLTQTPPGFVFDIKVFSLFTGHPTPFSALPRFARKGLEDYTQKNLYLNLMPPPLVDALWRLFNDLVKPVSDAGKLGVLLLQFPPWFHAQHRNMSYIAECKEKLPGYDLAVEFRTNDWLNERNRESTLELLRKLDIALVCVDGPQGLKTSVEPLAEVTSSIGIIRFHGRNTENWEKKDIPAHERYKYLYREDELREWLPRIRKMADATDELHIIFKNKYQDNPVKNAGQMARLLA